MAKLVSRPYEEDEVAQAPQVGAPDAVSPAIGLIGVLIVILLLAGALFVVYGAFASGHAPVR